MLALLAAFAWVAFRGLLAAYDGHDAHGWLILGALLLVLLGA